MTPTTYSEPTNRIEASSSRPERRAMFSATLRQMSGAIIVASLLVIAFAASASAGGHEAGWKECGGTEGVYTRAYGSGRVEAWAKFHFNWEQSNANIFLYSPPISGSGNWSTEATGNYSHSYSWGQCAGI